MLAVVIVMIQVMSKALLNYKNNSFYVLSAYSLPDAVERVL